MTSALEMYLKKEAEKEVEEKTAEEKTEPKAKKGKNAKPKAVPKIKPYLIRVNTKERIMVMKQPLSESGILSQNQPDLIIG